MVPIAPSSTRMRCANDACSFATRSGYSQGMEVIFDLLLLVSFRLRKEESCPASRSWFACKQTQHLEMRRPRFARDAGAMHDFKPGLARELGKLLAPEAEVAMIEWRDR